MPNKSKKTSNPKPSRTSEEVSLKGKPLDNINWEMFCKYYVSEEMLGNGTRAYMKAYPEAKENTAREGASVLLTNPNISRRINELLDEQGLNDTFMDKQLLFSAGQHQDLSSKLKAVDIYNKMKGRYAPEKIEQKTIVTIDSKKLEKLDELLKNVSS